ncbi:NAD(P)H-binding protein [Rhizobium calliandrae]|uniref:NAD(P)H-binding protein n=1 Tax=Rhizobium calliandrae TaxID=1312182 RepID=A0ABT7KM37_9HYPH|nr:NAD(P)H-binding protein [Rhizobium calliandrae]MDL2409689.1 NAD(P)H-binding protein [Rhizobium calliandrae]
MQARKIAVFGASGGIGAQVVQQALDRGDTVTAVVRTQAQFDLVHARLSVVRVPALTDIGELTLALKDVEAVISGVGPRGPKDGPVASTATSAILLSMECAGVRRLVAVSAVPVGAVPHGESALNRFVILPLIGRLLQDLYADLTEMEHEIRQSNIDWTIVRPPKLSNKPLTEVYRWQVGGNVPRGYSISRANVAHAMLRALDDPQTIKQPVGVAE